MKDFESRSTEKETQTAENGWEELAKIVKEIGLDGENYRPDYS